MRIFDISVPLADGLPSWPGDPVFRMDPVLLLEKGDGARVYRITCGDHTGTHLDAPAHILEDGASLDDIPLSRLIGTALVADLRGCEEIDAASLKKLPLAGEERLLLRTDNSRLWREAEFHSDFVSLTTDGARYLSEIGIGLVGVDYLSVESFCGDGSVHRTLLESGVVILEGLDLSQVSAGVYELICLPLRVSAGAGAPARAVLLQKGTGE